MPPNIQTYLPAGFELSYAGVSFGPYTKTDGYTVTPVADPAGRTTQYARHVFRFRTYVATPAGERPGSTDAQARALRRALTKQGARFVYKGRGLDDLDVNPPGSGGVRDVQWGPKVRELGFTHYGGKSAFRLDWSVEVCIPVGATARYSRAPLALTYGVRFDIDPAGYTTRSLDVTLTVPATRASESDRTLPDTADAYREQLDPPRVPGFRRTWGPWQLDAAKTTLTGSITDTELGPNIPPPFVVEARAAHAVHSNTAGLTKWGGTFTGEYELHKVADVSIAAAAFFALARERIEHTARALRLVKDQVPDAYKSIFPVALSATEPEIYGRRKLNLSLAYTFTCPVKYLLGAAGLGRPVGGSNWTAWDYSLSGSSFHPRGSARLEFRASDDRLVDLLDGAPLFGLGGDEQQNADNLPFGPTAGSRYRPGALTGGFAAAVAQAFPAPAVGASWVYLENELWLEADNGTSSTRLIPLAPLTPAADLFGAVNDLAGRAWDGMAGDPPPATYPLAPGAAPVLPAGSNAARRAAAKAVVFMRGRAARVGWGVEPPRLVAVNGVPAVPANRLDRGEGFGVKLTAGANGVRVCVATWNLRYELAAMPLGRLPEPPNPLMGDPPP